MCAAEILSRGSFLPSSELAPSAVYAPTSSSAAIDPLDCLRLRSLSRMLSPSVSFSAAANSS